MEMTEMHFIRAVIGIWNDRSYT